MRDCDQKRRWPSLLFMTLFRFTSVFAQNRYCKIITFINSYFYFWQRNCKYEMFIRDKKFTLKWLIDQTFTLTDAGSFLHQLLSGFSNSVWIRKSRIHCKSRGWIKIATGDWWCHTNLRKRWDQRQNIVKKWPWPFTFTTRIKQDLITFE